MASQIYQLLYTSIKNPLYGQEELKKIEAEAIRFNEAHETTGLLMNSTTYFLQLLEGPESSVKLCMDKIKKDPRHHDILIKAEGNSDNRRFEAWYMMILQAEDTLLEKCHKTSNEIFHRESINCTIDKLLNEI